jgi:hypothetical protein
VREFDAPRTQVPEGRRLCSKISMYIRMYICVVKLVVKLVVTWAIGPEYS